MLFLLCQSQNERYAIAVDRVVEVLPLVAVHPIASPCASLAGVIHYRGATVPVLDLCLLTLGRPAAARMSTRIILLRLTPDSGGEPFLGLIAERATEMVRIPDATFQRVDLSATDAPYCGPAAWDAHGVIRRLEILGLASLVSDHALSVPCRGTLAA